MNRSAAFIFVVVVLSLLPAYANGQKQEKLVLDKADQFEVVLSAKGKYITYVTGNVVFQTETGHIYCDSARWLKGENARLNGHVIIDDAEYRLEADSAFYDLNTDEALALGKRVLLWSYEDSLYAVGQHAFFNDREEYFIMEKRPVLYIRYPDTANMIEVIADVIEHNSATSVAEARGDVKISSEEFSSVSNRAVMHTDGNMVDLFEQPSVQRGESVISGSTISIRFEDDLLTLIDVVDTAKGNFKEPVNQDTLYFDESVLSGNRIILDFDKGELASILCYGQAYSWYYPSPRGGSETHQNSVSGDTIRFYIENEELQKVNVIGGAIGRYISTKTVLRDSVLVDKADTVDYNSVFIEYHIQDSLITLSKASHVESGGMSLDAYDISFDTRANIIEAYSAFLDTDTVGTRYSMAAQLQPHTIPVILRDQTEEIFGDYLLYSIDTEKGRIVQSKSDYDAGLYYGKKLYREDRHIFYVDDGRYTTCDADEPHFHFHSSHMKLIEGDKLIAKPVVFYIERVPVFALPYYVFPLKKGRHSGFLPFTFGKLWQGERYLRDVGYYWAASDYWDWQGSLDYHEEAQTLVFNSRVNFRKRYVLNGSLSGTYARETDFNAGIAEEIKRNRWTFRGNYTHEVTPTLLVSASGDFQSDKTYYSDFSQNLEDRLNQNSTKSQISFSKKFGKQTSLSGNVVHTVDMVRETRSDDFPRLSLSLPTVWPFGSSSKDEQGRSSKKWYNEFSIRYSPSMINFSSRVTKDSLATIGGDTLSYRSRKKYTRISHNPRLTLPSAKFGDYLSVNPSFSYSEAWVKVYQTDQSDTAGIDASQFYRMYSWSTAATAKTTLYGTLYPNLYGLVGFRHVMTPSVTYSYSPDINLHPEVKTYAGGEGSAKSSKMTFRLEHLFQAKVRKEQVESNKDLLSVSSSFSYDFELEDKPLSILRTSFQSSALPVISSLSGGLTHSFYDPNTGEENIWSPYLQSFNIRADFRIAGKNFIFDDPAAMPRGVDSLHQLNPIDPLPSSMSSVSGGKGWSLNASYDYSESGREGNWSKSSFIDITLRFNLTPTTSITCQQRYDIVKGKTVQNRVNIVRKIHCWSGSLYWVPIGSNRGFGFKLFVTAIPEIKVDSNHDTFLESIQQ